MGPHMLPNGIFYNEEKSDHGIGSVNININPPLSMACLRYASILETSSWLLDHQTRHSNKRLKTSESIHMSTNSNAMNRSPTILPRLRFRDHIWTYTQRYHAAEAVEEAAAALIRANDTEDRVSSNGMRLVQLLIASAEAVACRDKSHASVLLSELRANALVFGSAFQRVASCFTQSLEARLELVRPLGAVGFISPPSETKTQIAMEKKKREEALRLVYEICPYIQFGHFVANSAILEAFEGESYVHVVDLGMTLGLPGGHQWRGLMEGLATRPGQPPSRIRITGVGMPGDTFKTIGDELEAYADSLGLNLEFTLVETSLENLRPEHIRRLDKEVMVINSVLQLHCVVKESRGALNSVLQMMHGMSPKMVLLVEQESSHNGPFFLGRFMEALQYYSAIFDSVDAVLPKYDTRRAKIEQLYYGEEIRNIVSSEGEERVERHERAEQWRRRMARAGFQAAPLRNLARVNHWMDNTNVNVSQGYTLVEHKGCLLLGWKSKPIVAASCWKC